MAFGDFSRGGLALLGSAHKGSQRNLHNSSFWLRLSSIGNYLG
jgi:hypothetical protein